MNRFIKMIVEKIIFKNEIKSFLLEKFITNNVIKYN